MRGKITKRAVDSLSPAYDAETVLWDAEVKGFGIRVRRSSKSYILQYRVGTGRSAGLRKLTIGKHGSPWTAETARAEAKRSLAEVAAGRDPAASRQEDRKALSFNDLIDLYLTEGASHKKSSTLKVDRGRIEHHIRPLLGKLRADRIGRADVERMRNAITAGKTAGTSISSEKRRPGSIATGGKGAAAQCVALVSSIYAFAIGRCLCAENPARGVKKAPVRKIERFLSEAEFAQLAEALDAEAQHSGNPYPPTAIKLLLLTGCRKSEITNLLWDHVDFDRECLRLPDSKSGAKVVYLNAPARALLHNLPRVAHSSRVILAMRADSAGPAIDKVWSRVRRAAGLSGVRLHDLRHSFASVGAAGGLSLPIIGALLGHKHATTTARYAHLSADPLRAANDAVGAKIAAAMSRRPRPVPGVDVVNLPSRRSKVLR
ncbi:MAG TPA: tyrosine-type recombinase/integrase [Stellaceae bacterium]|nr:tyrosine-type recombinase/integrase [Stellaceae bacterium]